MTLPDTIAAVAVRTPWLSRPALWCAVRFSMATGRKLHWRAVRLANSLDYRAPVGARLGNGMPCLVPWIDDAGKAIHQSGWYEHDTIRAFQTILKPGDTFLDIGANFGQYTLLGSKLVGESGHVIAFEPEPVSYAWLAGNVRRNELANVRLVSCALGEKAATLDLYVGSPDNLGTTSFRKQYNFSGRTVAVPVRTLDEYCGSQGIAAVNAIKLDVEGAELSVLRGAERVLASHPILVVEFEESNQRRFDLSCDDLERFLTARGYELHTIGADGATTPYTAADARAHRSLNVLARPRAEHSRF